MRPIQRQALAKMGVCQEWEKKKDGTLYHHDRAVMAHGLAATRAAFAVAREDAPEPEEGDDLDGEGGSGKQEGKGKKKSSNKRK